MSDMSLHTPSDAGAIHGHSAADLARFAGADELSAGVAVAGAGGRRLRARLLADELAAGHCVMMRLAAKADYAIGNAAGMGDRFALPFDLLAARFAGTAGRLMDQFRRGALSLPKVAGPDAEGEGRWVGVCFENEELAPPEEVDRRLAQAKAARAAARQSDPQSPPPRPEEQAALERADAAARRLVAEAQAANLTAGDDPEARQRLFLDQVAAGHRMMMRLTGRADWQIDRLGAPDAEPEPTRRAVLRLSSAVARLMERVRLGLLAIERLAAGPGGDPRPIAGYYWTGKKDLFNPGTVVTPANDVGGGQKTEARGQKASRPDYEVYPASPGLPAGTFCPPSSVVCLLKRGRLRNGNPLRRLHDRPTLRRPDPRRLQLPPAGDEEPRRRPGPLPLPRRQEHRPAHRRRPAARPHRPPRPRLPLRRGHRPAQGRHGDEPPPPRAAFQAYSRWTWGGSSRFACRRRIWHRITLPPPRSGGGSGRG